MVARRDMSKAYIAKITLSHSYPIFMENSTKSKQAKNQQIMKNHL